MNNFTKAAASLTASALFSLAFTACSDSTSANDEIFANISSRVIPHPQTMKFLPIFRLALMKL